MLFREVKDKIYLTYVIFIITITIFFSFLIIREKNKIEYELIPTQFSEKVPINKCIPCQKIYQEPPNCPFYSEAPNSLSIYDGIVICIPATIIKKNSYGFRDYEYPQNKPPNTFRIAAIGDSYTFGLGVNLTDTYPKILEKLLNKKVEKIKYEVLNFGHSGYDIFEKVKEIEIRALKFSPDLIIFQYAGDDIMNSTEVNLIKEDLTKKYLSENSNVKELNISLQLELELLHAAHRLYMDKMEKKEIQPIIEPPLNKLANITSGKGISILILLVNTPDRDKLIIEEIAKKYGWIVMDFTKVSKDPKFILHEKDNHFNPLGNQLIAEEIYQKLIENKLIPFK